MYTSVGITYENKMIDIKKICSRTIKNIFRYVFNQYIIQFL